MSDDPRSLIAGAASSARDGEVLGRLLRRSWPAPSDATVPAARAWVRLWAPRPMPAVAADCACAVGRCGWCN